MFHLPRSFSYFLLLVFYMVTTPVLATPVIEFYNTNLDNYFITADANEAAQIDGGSAGPGWSRTGNTFNSGGSTPVCRFYGSQSPGPNSHFYTVDPSECAALKQLQATTPATQKRWNFESLDFISTPATNGACTAGTVPVYRAYNNGYSRGVDSNHRITSNLAAIQEVVSRGWSNEGVVMCASSGGGGSQASNVCPVSTKSDVWANVRLGCLQVGQKVIDLSSGASGQVSDMAFIISEAAYDISFNNINNGKSRYFQYFLCVKNAPSSLSDTFYRLSLAGDLTGAMGLGNGGRALPNGISTANFSISGGNRAGFITTTCNPSIHPVIIDYATGKVQSINAEALTSLTIYDY